jgi:GT2 family glycosyltransferase
MGDFSMRRIALFEPSPLDLQPRNDVIRIRGEAQRLYESDVIEVEAADLPLLNAHWQEARLNFQKSVLADDSQNTRLFFLDFDASSLPNGRIPLQVRVRSKGNIIAKAETVVTVDHDQGFPSDYDRWIEEFERPANALLQLRLEAVESLPTIGVLLIVSDAEDEAHVDRAIRSVIRQSRPGWELIVVPSGETATGTLEAVQRFTEQEKRIRIAEPRQGSVQPRRYRDLASGIRSEHVAIFRASDELAPSALARLSLRLEEYPEADLLYADEDELDENRRRHNPFFKPDWSPDLLLSFNYIGAFAVVRKSLLEEVEPAAFHSESAAFYDLILRSSERAKRIEHIPGVLLHSGARASISTRQEDLDEIRDVIQAHCDRTNRHGQVEPGLREGRWRVRYKIPGEPRVSIIIPSGGNAGNLRKNLKSILNLTSYRHYEIVVVDNSRGDDIQELASSFAAYSARLRYIDWRHRPFNFSEINNVAARQCNSPLLLFLNDDMSVITQDWLDAMVEQAVRPEVGAVGAKLLYPDGVIQHSGIFMGFRKSCGHAFRGLASDERHYFDFPDVIRNVSAVTGACLMARADVFWEAGGFDQENFAIDFNDVDLCLKIRANGYRVIYTPYALLYHHESASKGNREILPEIEQVNCIQHRWRGEIASDPYYNPNLTRDEENYSLRKLAPVQKLRQDQSGVTALPWTELFSLIDAAAEKPRPETPLLSIVTPTWNTKPSWFIEAALSVFRQSATDWEWCIVDDCSSATEFQTLFPDLERSGRVNILKLDTPHGISAATNKGVEIASGQYICFLDHDDLLSPDAVHSLAEACREGYDAVYSDSDKIDDDGERFEPFYKPDWSPEYFRGVMYIGHLLCVRRDLLLEVGGFDSRFDGIQDYEFFLRYSERTQHIHHIPKILYHWRAVDGSVAASSEAKGDVSRLQATAVQEHLNRLGLQAEAVRGEFPHRVQLAPCARTDLPIVSIIIPTKDNPEMIERCLYTLFSKTTYSNFEVICVDNETSDAEALDVLKTAPVERLIFPGAFNFSKANNMGVKQARGPYLVFMNNDIEILTPDWIQEMLYYADQPDVGAVGALLLYPDETVQHAGVVLGCRGTADHVSRGASSSTDGYAGSLSCAREVTAVTAACLMIRRALFDEVGGFNEHFFTAYQDVDLCLKVLKQNKRNIFTPRARFIHHESFSRGKYYDFVDRNLLLDFWEPAIKAGDRYYNPNLDVQACDYSPRATAAG